MKPQTMLVTLYDMASEDGPDVTWPTPQEVVAEIVAAGFECAPQPAKFAPSGDIRPIPFACTAASRDSFDLLEVLVASKAVCTMIAPRAHSLTIYVCVNGDEPTEICDVPSALLDATTKEDGFALVEEWVTTTSLTDDAPPGKLPAWLAVLFVQAAWAGNLNTPRIARTPGLLEETASGAARFRQNWDQWVSERRNASTTDCVP